MGWAILATWCGYAPGDMPSVYPPGTAKKVPAGSDFLFEIHYTPIGKVRTDRSKVGLIFAKAPVTRQAYTLPIAEDEFLIPPHQDNVPVAASRTFAQDTRLLGFMPHMHLRGKDFRYTIVRPGKAPETILSVPAYDFGWQSYYVLAEPLDLPKGTRIDCLAHYDNSDKNPYNPDPSKTVRWGDQTFEEMMIGYIDIDLPRDVAPVLESRARRPSCPRPARGVIQALGTLLGGRGHAAAPARAPTAPPADLERPGSCALSSDSRCCRPSSLPRSLVPQSLPAAPADRCPGPGAAPAFAPLEFLVGSWKGRGFPGTIPPSGSAAGPRPTPGPGCSPREGRSA